MPSLPQRAGTRLRQLRKQKRWSQHDLAKRAGLDTKHYGAIERGQANTTLFSLETPATALEVDAIQLFLPIPSEGLPPRTLDRMRLTEHLDGCSDRERRLPPRVMDSVLEYRTK